MSVKPRLELVSFKICPYVQRAVIALNEKGAEYTLTHLVPGEEPDWFKQVSPMGKVPVLLVDGTPVFESAVIMEYVDEVYGPQLHPEDALQKAL
nr:glutathione S-transferase family protein [Thiolinea sp.]